MSRERVFTTVVGLATIVGTLMYAVDNQWIDGVPELNGASKTVELTPPLPAIGKQPAKVKLKPAVRAKPRRAKKSKRRVASRRVTHRKIKRSAPKRRTVSIFAAAKDIPTPNQQR